MKLLRQITATCLAIMLLLSMSSVALAKDYKGASDWAIAELTRADNDGFITVEVAGDFGKEITREEFCEIAVILYDRLGGSQELETYNPFTDTLNPNVIKAYNAEIITGVGNNLFAPDDLLTREQLCVMIIRAMMSAGITFGNENQYNFQQNYTDEDKVSSWAYLQVKIMNDFKIMNGSDSMLTPQNKLTREQAIIMLERAYLREFEITDNVLTAYLGSSTEVVIPSGLTAIDDDVFHNNNFVKTIVIPDSVATIGYASFRDMMALESITFGSGVKTIGEAAFELSENLGNVILPDGLETIEYMAFQDCLSFTEITIPASVTSIEDQAFYRCEGLTTVTFEGNALESIGETAFELCDQVTFVCEAGSIAETYANQVGIPVTLK